MKKHLTSRLIRACAIVCGLCTATTSGAADSAATPSPISKTKKAKAPKPPSDKGSGENRAERDKRLLRECRGKPNSGACEGFAN